MFGNAEKDTPSLRLLLIYSISTPLYISSHQRQHHDIKSVREANGCEDTRFCGYDVQRDYPAKQPDLKWSAYTDATIVEKIRLVASDDVLVGERHRSDDQGD
ncbi:hypothetical protein AC579_6010 [Pseudocercospora musae]|uniref:Uncharacterized protein n=1 Tax=Pseudocercospora musae TaxID=113226 RepID=A0A139H787_9PEZI|nr:hypothetical protein AC579_6010 [Pseudocercospora musae]